MTSSMPERGSQEGDRVDPELGQPTDAGSRAVAPARTVAAPADPGRTQDRCQLISACPTEHFPSTLTDPFILEEGNFFDQQPFKFVSSQKSGFFSHFQLK